MVLNYFKRLYLKKKWRKLNSHNFTTYCQIFGDINKVHIGNYTYGEIYVSSPNTNYDIYIGHFCSIAGEVRFLLGADHSINRISTYPFNSTILKCGIDAVSKGDIIVDDDVWIGQGAIILSGVHIGQGAVVAAGSVVTKDVPPYAIVGGVPAKVIRYRFEPDMIEELLKIDYSKLTKEDIEKHIDELYVELKDKSQLGWMPGSEGIINNG